MGRTYALNFSYENPFLFSQTLHLYGGQNSDFYLGCLNCPSNDAFSIWNEQGIYGNPNSIISIWNEYGEYGSEFSLYSPWNDYTGTYPPVMFDEAGNFYGYLTRDVTRAYREIFG